VIVPIHDAAPYLGQTIESILAQTYRDWEAILVDDASTDGSHGVARAFARAHPERITAIALGRNVGVAAARRLAVERSHGGELIALLDHDDWWLERYLERTVALYDEARAQDRRVGIVACDALLCTPNGLLAETWADRCGWADPLDYDAMIERNAILARMLVARRAYDEVGGFAPECLASDDYDLCLRVMEAGYDAIHTREALVVWRMHPGSLSARSAALMASGEMATMRRALGRGALTRRQRRAVRARLRHARALRARARTRDAAADGHPLLASLLALRAVPDGAVAFLQRPDRWGEWSRDLGRMAQRVARRA
jgi:GT2 family glycosyltransferase